KSLQIGIGLGKIEDVEYLSLSIRFKYSAQKVDGKLTLTLTNGRVISLALINSGLAYIGNSEVCQSTFQISPGARALLMKSSIKFVAFHLEDNLRHVLTVSMNSNLVSSQLKCL
ncbi:MAG: hypothetical protein ABI091_16105, partial [Ferruginibacter sp.]